MVLTKYQLIGATRRKVSLCDSCKINSESKKDGDPRNQVPEEGFESEEGWHDISTILLYYISILFCQVQSYQIFHEILKTLDI